VVHRDDLYAGTFDRGIARLGPDGRFLPIPGSPPFINTLVSTPAGLVAGTPKGLFREEADGFRRLDLGDGLGHVNAVLLGHGGTLWIATSGGVVALAPDGRVRVLIEASGLPGRIAHSLAETADGALWVGTLTGLVRLDGHGVTRFSRAAGNLPHDWVTAILPDGDGVLAGTYDAGVWRLTPSGVGMPVPGLERLWVNPAGLSRAAGALSVATLGDGLILGGRRVAGLPSDDVTAVLSFAGKLWIATRGGLATATSGA
jgi:ligand-binding sensor domain-containing protein